MTKVVFKGATEYEYVVNLQEGCVPVNVERIREHWPVQRVDEHIGRVQHEPC